MTVVVNMMKIQSVFSAICSYLADYGTAVSRLCSHYTLCAHKRRPQILSDKILPYLFLPLYVATSYLFISYFYFQIVHHQGNLTVTNLFEIGQMIHFGGILMKMIYRATSKVSLIPFVSFLIDNPWAMLP